MKTSNGFRQYLVIVATGLTICYALGTFMEKAMPEQFSATYTANNK